MGYGLTEDDKAGLGRQHRVERDGRVRDRIKAIILFEDGWDIDDIAHALMIDRETVYRHVEEYKAVGKLKPAQGGSSPRLDESETQALEKQVTETLYPTIKPIIAWIREQFGKTFTVSGVTYLLHRLGLRYRKPTGVPAKAVLALQEEFIL